MMRPRFKTLFITTYVLLGAMTFGWVASGYDCTTNANPFGCNLVAAFIGLINGIAWPVRWFVIEPLAQVWSFFSWLRGGAA